MNLTRVTGEEQEAQGLSRSDSQEGADRGLTSALLPLYLVAPRRMKVRIRFHVKRGFQGKPLSCPLSVFPHKGLCSAP